MPVLYNLTNRESIISFTGSDAETFLQGQTTCDVSRLSSHKSVFGALCNPKGRVICLFHLFKIEQTIYMVLNAELSEAIVKRLKMFVFRADVQIKNVSDQYVTLGSVNNIDDDVKNELKPLATIQHEPPINFTMFIVSNSSYQPLTNSSILTLETELNNWDKALIAEGLPNIKANTSESFIPQMLNLDVLGGISFQKGCYTGQEVIARLHYKGTVKRRLYIFNSNSTVYPATDLFIPDNANAIGTVLECHKLSDTDYIGTVVLKQEYAAKSSINCEAVGEITIKVPSYL